MSNRPKPSTLRFLVVIGLSTLLTASVDVSTANSADKDQLLKQVQDLRKRLATADYCASMTDAANEWTQNHLERTRTVLDRTMPELRNWEWDYFRALCNAELSSTTGQFSLDSGEQSVSVSPGGNLVAFTSSSAQPQSASNGIADKFV